MSSMQIATLVDIAAAAGLVRYPRGTVGGHRRRGARHTRSDLGDRPASGDGAQLLVKRSSRSACQRARWC
jgi:hypothetical protein